MIVAVVYVSFSFAVLAQYAVRSGLERGIPGERKDEERVEVGLPPAV